MDMERMIREGEAIGFTHVAALDVQTIDLKQEVRDMCAKNTCGMFGKNWCCPPGVGELEVCRQKLSKYTKGILVQTVGELEDAFDVETMMETEATHKEHFEALMKKLEEEFPDMLAIGAGTCTRCKTCTYPEQPCRFPEKTFASMEAYGMLVTQVCQANNLPYYYGPNTLAYTSCFLLQ